MMFYQGPQKTDRPIGKPVKRAKRAFEPLKTRVYHNQGFNTRDLPSCTSEYDKSKDPLFASKKRYDGEMADREAAAQIEVERKKTMVAPLYNKAGYEYIGGITDATILKNLGRKL